jgi:hypothetical protein
VKELKIKLLINSIRSNKETYDKSVKQLKLKTLINSIKVGNLHGYMYINSSVR